MNDNKKPNYYIYTHTLVNMYICTIVRTRTCYYTTIACGNFEKVKGSEKKKQVSSHGHRSGSLRNAQVSVFEDRVNKSVKGGVLRNT